jgi:hypothetical protein
MPNIPDPVVSSNSVSFDMPAGVKSSPQFTTARNACKAYIPTPPTGQNFTTQQQADYVRAAQCMRSHGAQLPDPVFSGGRVRFNLPPGMNPNSAQFEAARKVCQRLIPNGLPYSASSPQGD